MTGALRSGLYVVTDGETLTADALLERTARILQAGISALQYRSKSPDHPARHRQAVALQELCRQFGTTFIINDDLELAAALNADGIHLGRDDAPCKIARNRLGNRAIIGVSCYDKLENAVLAQQSGADYVAFGAFYPSRSKIPPARATPDLLTQARSCLQIPIVAIGGITPDNGTELLSAGADLLAVIHSVYSDPEPERVIQKFAGVFALHARPAST